MEHQSQEISSLVVACWQRGRVKESPAMRTRIRRAEPHRLPATILRRRKIGKQAGELPGTLAQTRIFMWSLAGLSTRFPSKMMTPCFPFHPLLHPCMGAYETCLNEWEPCNVAPAAGNVSAGKWLRPYILLFLNEPTPTDARASRSVPSAFLLPREGSLPSILPSRRCLSAERLPIACNPDLRWCRSTLGQGKGQRPAAASRLPSAQFTPHRGRL